MDHFLESHRDFIETEMKLGLDQLSFAGSNPWELVRFQIFNYFMKSRGMYQEGQKTVKVSLFERAARFTGAGFHSPRQIKPAHIMVIGHQRRQRLKNGLYRDIYLQPYLDLMDGEGIGYNYLERPYARPAHFTPAETKSIIYLDNLFLGIGGKDEKTSFINCLENKLSQMAGILELNIKILRSIAKTAARQFSVGKPRVRKMLLRSKAKKILMAVSYSRTNQLLTITAKELGIEVIEVQHGIISRFHLGYCFEDWKKVPVSFPDKLLLFGDIWKTPNVFPLNSDSLITVGAPHLERAMQTSKSKDASILFISQGSVGEEIIDFAMKLNKIAGKDLKIGVKLHPAEQDRVSPIYTALKQEKGIVLHKGDEDIYSIFGKYSYAAGGYSTALLEALEAGLNVFAIPVPGSHYLDLFIENGAIRKIQQPQEIIELLRGNRGDHSIMKSVFSKFNSTLVKKILSQ